MMSVDERRETFHVNRIAPSDLDERLLAQAYRPDVVAAVHTLVSRGAKPLSSALDGPLTQGRTPEYGEDGEICLKTRNVVGGLVDGSSVDRVTSRFARQHGTSRISNETVLMNRSGAGSVGRVSIYFGAEGVFTNEELFRFRIAAPHDPAFVTVFFGSSLGERVLERGVNGSTGQLKLVQEHVESVPVLFPHPDAQRYIGDKVRQAEQLRERARRLEAQAHSALAEWSGTVVPPTFREKPRLILAPTVSPHSLGPSFAWAMQGHTEVPGAKPFSSYIESCASGEPIRADQRTPGSYPYYGASGPIDTHNEYNFEGEYLVVAQDGTIGRACVARGRFWANNHVWVLKVREAVDPDAVAAYLDKHYVYWPGLTTGSVVPKVTSENLMLAAIPGPVASASDAGAKFRSANSLRSAAEELVDAAKLLVEHLIEGRLNEAELVCAQKALEAGDRRADREILKALRQSDSPNAKPLIADVDALYALLDGSEGQDA